MCIFIFVCTSTLVLKSRLMWMNIRINDDDDEHFSMRFDQNHSNRFYQSWARLGLAPFGSGSFFGLTQGTDLSTQDTMTRLDLSCGSARFARGPAQLETRPITARGSAQLG